MNRKGAQRQNHERKARIRSSLQGRLQVHASRDGRIHLPGDHLRHFDAHLGLSGVAAGSDGTHHLHRFDGISHGGDSRVGL